MNLCLEEIRPVNRSASSPKLEEKVGISFSSCSAPRRGLSRSSRHLKPISLAEDLHQALRPKKFGTWDATDIAKRRVEHHPFRHCHSIFFTADARFTLADPMPRCCRLGQCEWSPDTESAVGASSGGHQEVIGQY